MAQYKETPKTFVEPTKAEVKARTKRNIAIALGLIGFMIFVFVTSIARGDVT